MKNPPEATAALELLRDAIIDQRISIGEAIQVVIDVATSRAPPLQRDFSLDAVRQRSTEARLAAVEAWQLAADTRREVPPLLRSFLENWRVVAVVTLITSIETVCITYLLAT